MDSVSTVRRAGGVTEAQILLPPPDSVDHSKLQEGEEDEAGAGQEPNVNEFHIVHLQNKTITVDFMVVLMDRRQ